VPRSFKSVKRNHPDIPAGLEMRAVVDHFENFYGEAIIALSDLIRVRPGAAKHVSGYWHEPKNKIGLPAWEREFDKKFADRVDLILGIAGEFGLDKQAYLQEFLEACEKLGGKPPADLSPFLPWNMAPKDIARLKEPVTGVLI